MDRILELEKFYETKYDKEQIVNAINHVNKAKVDFELYLKDQLTIRDFIFTFLSYKTSWNDFMYIWKAFSQEPSPPYMLNKSHEVIKDKFFKKNDLALAIRFDLSEKNKREM